MTEAELQMLPLLLTLLVRDAEPHAEAQDDGECVAVMVVG